MGTCSVKLLPGPQIVCVILHFSTHVNCSVKWCGPSMTKGMMTGQCAVVNVLTVRTGCHFEAVNEMCIKAAQLNNRYGILDKRCHEDFPFWDESMWQPSYKVSVINFVYSINKTKQGGWTLLGSCMRVLHSGISGRWTVYGDYFIYSKEKWCRIFFTSEFPESPVKSWIKYLIHGMHQKVNIIILISCSVDF